MKKFNHLKKCPGCGMSFQGDPIPKRDQEAFGGATHFERQIALYDRDQDMTIAYRCPDCAYTWDRFTGKEIKQELPFPVDLGYKYDN
jgi:uncharacterized C2H2 Zn-finger protein